LLGSSLVKDRRTLALGRLIAIDRIIFKAFPVAHSIEARPAVALRIRRGGVVLSMFWLMVNASPANLGP
jgi:hypothetical protein